MATSKKPAPRAKPGRKPPKPYTPREWADAFRGLQSEIEFASKVVEQRREPRMSPQLGAAVHAYLVASEPRKDAMWRLAHTAVRLAKGTDIELLATQLQPFGLELKGSRRALNAALARKYPQKWGKAFAIFKIIAKGTVEFPQRRSPTRELVAFFEYSAAPPQA